MTLFHPVPRCARRRPGLRRLPLWLGAALLLAATRPTAAAAPDDARYVDPFIGTGAHGHTFPGATLPFGMVQASPDTRLKGWDSCSGYHYSDDFIYGFSHTHLSGTGIPDYCDVLVMPETGPGTIATPDPAHGKRGYGAHFSHADEVAQPGYYAVRLEESGIKVELTVTPRVALHRYTFPAGAARSLVIDLEHRDRVLDSELRVVSPTEIAGYRRSSSWAKDQLVYFDIRFQKPVAGVQLYSDERPVAGAQRRGKKLKALVRLAAGDDAPVELKVALSPVSIDGARRNLAAELPGWNFARTRAAARAAWNRVLDKITVRSRNPAELRTFYTALYHAFICPNLFCDVDGAYRGRDGKIHQTDHGYYTVFSLWDTFRALHPLMTILDPAATRDFIRTFLLMYQQGGLLPVWDLAGNETFCMNGYHAVSVITDAYTKGIRGFDTGLALRAMEHSAMLNHFGLGAYRRYGYISRDQASGSVSRTLEYAYDDWCIAQFAGETGHAKVREEFLRRGQRWMNLFDPQTKFFRGRTNGGWVMPFDPREINVDYTEGDAWQYRFAVPQDIPGLIDRFGGDAAFDAALDGLFTAPSQTQGRKQADVTGLIGQYAQGNEPSHHMAYLYDYAGRPYETQRRVRQIVTTLYSDGPAGLCGNDDCGQMSAWYVFSALGFYPVTPGTTQYAIGSPLFDRATIDVGGGRHFTIVARHQAPANVYITSATLNGRPFDRCYLTQAEIMRGGTLEVTMSDHPNPAWAAAPASRPGRPYPPTGFVAIPAITVPHSFRHHATVTMRAGRPGEILWYTLDGTTPVPGRARRYEGPFPITATSRITCVAVRGSDVSPPDRAEALRVSNHLRVTVHNPISRQYLAGGPQALVDGLTGGTDYATGRWQGYHDCNLDVTVDLGRVEHVRRVTIGFLQSPDVYILFPREVRFAVSSDGKTWRPLGTVRPPATAPGDDRPRVARVACPAHADGRYLRIRAPSSGSVLSQDGTESIKSWIFADEIQVDAH